MGWPKDARKWSRQEILRDVEQAKELFRQRRLEDPKERYLEAFTSLERADKKLVEREPPPRKGIQVLLTDASQSGKFMIGCTVGEHNADIVARLADGRVLALECKASNSEINSRKPINKEVAVDAGSWVRQFGEQNVVPAAVIQGVFNPGSV